MVNVLIISSEEPSHKLITKFWEQIYRKYTNSEEEIRMAFPTGYESLLFSFDHVNTITLKNTSS